MANGNIANKIEQPNLIPKPEVAPASVAEKVIEVGLEKSPIEKTKETEGAKTAEISEGASSVSTAQAPADAYHQRREKEIDACLSEGLGETFLAMTPEKQKVFQEEGEKTVKKINVLLDATKVNLGKIVSLIRRWLSLITGVNRFFS